MIPRTPGTTARRDSDVRRNERDASRLASAVPWLLTAAAIGTQIAYPLLDGEPLRRVTLASVVLFFLASVTHAIVHRGAPWAMTFVAIAAGVAFAAEVVGVHTGVPFGDYAYAGTLGPAVWDVPLVVPLAWTMMAYPVFLAARSVTARFALLLGGWGLAGWDVFLDPQMVRDGHWRWADPMPALPGVPDVPVTNYLGWVIVATVLMAALDRVLPRVAADDAVPAVLLFWTYVGSIIGNLFWFGTVGVAVAGGVAMGTVVLPYAWLLWRRRR